MDIKEGNRYQPIESEHIEPEVVDFVTFEGINLSDPSTFTMADGSYKIIGKLPFPHPAAPHINYRSHHLPNFWLIEGSYCLLKNLRVKRSSADFDEGSFWLRSAARILAQSDGKEHHHDYVGDSESGAEKFNHEVASSFQTLADAHYNDLICISILPDQTCFGCQSTPIGEIGAHCYDIAMKDVEGILKFIKIVTSSGQQNIYKVFLQSKEGIPLGIVTTKRNLYIRAGRDVD